MKKLEIPPPINTTKCGYQYKFYINTLYERILKIWNTMTQTEKRILAKYIQDQNYKQAEPFITLLERHGGSMGD